MGIVIGLQQGVSDMITTNLLFVELMIYDCMAITSQNNHKNALQQYHIDCINSSSSLLKNLKIGNLFANYIIWSFIWLFAKVIWNDQV